LERLLTLSISSYQHWLIIRSDNLLFRNCLELVRSVNEPLSDVVCKLKNGGKVAYTIAKAHRDLEYSSVIVGKLDSKR